MRHFRAVIALLCACCAPLTAAEPIRVVTSIRPLQLLAVAVGGDAVKVDALLDANSSPHDYQLRPSDRMKLDRADLVVWIGPSLEHFLQPVLKVVQRRTMVIALDDGAADPHLWMDPLAMRAAAQRLAAVYAQLRPQQAELFRQNVLRLQVALDREDAWLRQRLASPEKRGYIVEHDAYDRFESRYGLSHAAALTDRSELPPSVSKLIFLRKQLDSGAVGCVLTEPGESAQIRSLTQQRSAVVVRLDPMAANVEMGPEGLAQFYRQLGAAIATCVEG